ncbi:MAG: hypothetical protein IH892_11675 [Planctomycetes bacterium]|nr:hypothetical protein [Planctomycetota bacterium]
MTILGIDFFFEVSTACIVKEGQLMVAHSEDPSEASQHASTLPLSAIDRCLETAELTLSDLEGIAVSIEATRDWLAESLYDVARLDNALPVLKPKSWRTYFKQRDLWMWIRDHWPSGGQRPEVYFVPHHLSHAGAAFLASPFDRAAILTLEGSREWSTSFLGQGEGKSLTQHHESHFPMSLGAFFETATEFCGLRPDEDEAKTMGLAALGDPDRFYDPVASLVTIDKRGGIQIDLSYFNFQRWVCRRSSARFISTFGPPRAFDGEFEARHIDLAAAFQRVLEERTLQLCTILRERTQLQHLVFAGGVSRNSALSHRMSQEMDFDELFVMPATGKTGPAIEAAFHVYHRIMEPKRSAVPSDLLISGEGVSLDVEKVIPLQMLPTIPDGHLASSQAPAPKKRHRLIWHEGKITCVSGVGGEELSRGTEGNGFGALEGIRPHDVQLFIPTASGPDRRRIIDYLEDRSLVLVITDVMPEEMTLPPALAEMAVDPLLQTHLQRGLRTGQYVSALRAPGFMEKLGSLFGVPGALKHSLYGSGEATAASPINAIRCFFSQGIDSLLIGNFVIEDRRM